MKLSELKRIVDIYHNDMINGWISDFEVVIPTNKKSYGQISYTKVKRIDEGFDWDSGLLIIYPENRLIEK